MARFSINQPLKGIEIYFEDRPSADVLSELKANRWRWLYSKKCWYNTNTQVNLEYAQRICSPKVNLPVVSNVHTIDYDITSSQGNSEESKAQKNGNLVECFDCHHIVSIHAQSCPNCGCPLSYTLEQYSRIAQEREAVQKHAEEEMKQRKEEEERKHRIKDALSLISDEFKTYFQNELEISIESDSISDDELYFLESEYRIYVDFRRHCEESIVQKKECVINAINYTSWDVIPYRIQKKITEHFQNSMSDLRPFEVQLDEVTPKLFMAHAVGLSFAGLETQYSAWLDLFCLRHYSNKIYKDGAVFQDISVLPVLEDDIKAIRSCTASNHDSKKADGEGSSNKNPIAKAAQNADILVYRSAKMTTVQIKINIQKNEGHKRYLGLKIGDSFLDSKGFRCVVTDIIRKDPYQDWQDLAPTLSVDEYPSVSYGHGRKWNR